MKTAFRNLRAVWEVAGEATQRMVMVPLQTPIHAGSLLASGSCLYEKWQKEGKPPKAACDKHPMASEEGWLLRWEGSLRRALKKPEYPGQNLWTGVAWLGLGCRRTQGSVLKAPAWGLGLGPWGGGGGGTCALSTHHVGWGWDLSGPHLPGLGSPWHGVRRWGLHAHDSSLRHCCPSWWCPRGG